MRSILLITILVVASLAGCSEASESPGSVDSTVMDQEPIASRVLRFDSQDRDVLEDNITVSVSLEEACLPLACPMAAVTGADPAHFKIIDVSRFLPAGMHTFIEVDASWERQNPVGLIGGMDMSWWSRNLWATDTIATSDVGRAHMESYVTHFGPDPAEIRLMVRDHEGLQGPVEVTLHVRATPLDDAVASGHVVAAKLEGGAVPITVHAKGKTTLIVRGPDEGSVFTTILGPEGSMELPSSSPRGEYLLTAINVEGPVKWIIPEANLTSPFMSIVDTSPDLGEPQPMPSGAELTWTVDVQTPPHWVGVVLDSYDGRSLWLQNFQVRVAAPDGTEVVSGDYAGGGASWYNRNLIGGEFGDPAYSAGTYTFTVSTDFAQGWQVYAVMSLYDR